jgi:hypothetical protein
MFTKPNHLVVRALHQLAALPTWVVVSEYLDDELQATYERITTTQDVAAIHELRGRAKFINELLKEFSTSGATLERLESNPPRRP